MSVEKLPAVGRPTDYDPDYHPNSFIELSREGMTKVEIASQWGISRQTLNTWSKDPNKPEFIDAYKIGETACEAYFINWFKCMAIGKTRVHDLGAAIWLSRNVLSWGRENPDNQNTSINLAYSLDKNPDSIKRK